MHFSHLNTIAVYINISALDIEYNRLFVHLRINSVIKLKFDSCAFFAKMSNYLQHIIRKYFKTLLTKWLAPYTICFFQQR